MQVMDQFHFGSRVQCLCCEHWKSRYQVLGGGLHPGVQFEVRGFGGFCQGFEGLPETDLQSDKINDKNYDNYKDIDLNSNFGSAMAEHGQG